MPRFSALLAASLLLSTTAQADTVTIFAAASMKDALDEVATNWQAETGHQAILSYAGSSKLAQQILEGAPAQIFLSASTDWMDKLAEEDLLLPESRVDLLGNSLALVSHTAPSSPPTTLDQTLDLKGLLGTEFLAMALVDAVPAGVYGKQALQALGLWESVSGQIAQADDVRAALMLVSTGEAPFGIVYGTDAAADPSVHLFGTFTPSAHDAITYPVAQIRDTATEAAASFATYLQGDAASATFSAHGFTVLK